MRTTAPPPPPKQAPETADGVAGDHLHRHTTGCASGLRKKGAWIRAWLIVDSTGQAEVVEEGKHAIMQRTGLPARDLRILDPILSYPSIVLGRERAIVVNLEHIKAIITAHKVMFLNSRDPLVTPFVKKLEAIFRHRQAIKSPQEARADGNNSERPKVHNSEEHRTLAANPPQTSSGDFPNKNAEENTERAQQDAENEHNEHLLKNLPFEFVALEACLEVACSALDSEASRLEQEAFPALDKLTTKISTLNLERVRQIKSRLVAITGRVQKVRDELEQLLDDDEDMAEMYLTEKFEQQLENSTASSMHEPENLTEEEVFSDTEHRTPAEMTPGDRGYAVSDTDIQETHNHIINSLRRGSQRTHMSTRSGTTKTLDVEELEMILEAYFVQIDGTLHKLSNLREYVDDTEDYINIMLDDKQNHLLQMGVMLSTATVVVSAFMAMTGVFGMNITIELFKTPMNIGMRDFLWTVGGGTIASVVLYVAAIAWCKYNGLLE